MVEFTGDLSVLFVGLILFLLVIFNEKQIELGEK